MSSVDAGTYTLTLQDLASETAQSHGEPPPIAMTVTTKKFKVTADHLVILKQPVDSGINSMIPVVVAVRVQEQDRHRF